MSLFGIATTPGTFGLTAINNIDSNNISVSNTLNWTWPANMFAGLAAGGPTFRQLTVQRSTTASNSPQIDVAYTTGDRRTPLADANWTDIKAWSFTQWTVEGFPSNWNDPWAHIAPVAYRLILNCSTPTNIEMDWIPVLVIPPRPLTIDTDPPPNDQPRIKWTVPDVSWFPDAP